AHTASPTPTPSPKPTQTPSDDGGGRETITPSSGILPWPTLEPTPTPDYEYDYNMRVAYWDYLDAKAVLETSIAEANSEAELFILDGGLPRNYTATTDPDEMHPFIIAYTNLKSANERFKEASLRMAQLFGIDLKVSEFSLRYWDDEEFNEVLVDFR
ncbi:MAG: hypothetical protein Q4B99_05590, partial [Clostridia bacterium]|nr:hypothetical protein [Clostridia bacterium]